MKYYLSTIADAVYVPDEETGEYKLHQVHKTGPVAKAYGLGLELAEYCITENCDKAEEIMPFFKENAENYTDSLVLHAPYSDLYPHAIDPKVAEVAYRRYDACYRLCEAHGIEKMVVHANFIELLYFPEWFKEKQTIFWKRFLGEHPGKCIIALENVLEPDPELITDIVRNVGDDRLKMCFDVGHANLRPGADVFDWLRRSAPYLTHLHIHNNNGPLTDSGSYGGTGDLHRPIGDGVIDYDKFLKLADDLVPEGLTATVESSGLTESCEWLKERGFI